MMSLFCAVGVGKAATLPVPSTEFQPSEKTLQSITLGGGCFWCTEAVFQTVKGVKTAISGYAGGAESAADYKSVSGGDTGHAEVVRVVYDPQIISLGKILQIFFSVAHDPTQLNRQGADRGTQYRSAVFVENEAQRTYVQTYISELEAAKVFSAPIVTTVEDLTGFYEAEKEHQNYAERYPDNSYIQAVAMPKIQKLGKDYADMVNPAGVSTPKLTEMEEYVVLKGGTEPAFKNKYWNHHEEGIYVDVVSGDPLFSSKDKFDSGTGWPSFTKPIEKSKVVDKPDDSLWMTRTEIRSSRADSHLGHVFEDGPKDKGGLRYCINSASLRFVAKADLEKEGYGEYLDLFK